jgi:ABC-type Mn2+/Zn2+ transport system permease subunit
MGQRDLDFCQWTDTPSPLVPLLEAFVVLMALAAVAGFLRRSSWRGGRQLGAVLFGTVLALSLLFSSYAHRYGLTVERTAGGGNCTPLSETLTWGILIGVNLAILAVWWIVGFAASRRIRQRIA